MWHLVIQTVCFAVIFLQQCITEEEMPARVKEKRESLVLCEKIKSYCRNLVGTGQLQHSQYRDCLVDPSHELLPASCATDGAHELLECRVITCYDKIKAAIGYLDEIGRCVCKKSPFFKEKKKEKNQTVVELLNDEEIHELKDELIE